MSCLEWNFTKHISIVYVDYKGMNLCFILRKYEWLKIFSTFRSSGLYFVGLYRGTTLEIIVSVCQRMVPDN